ncbi:MAG: class I SAM-dependent methyltransferase [Actinomycetota bacterium]|nr:class I SAM-dependent methyltransferase [Actinomycetota bacterium]
MSDAEPSEQDQGPQDVALSDLTPEDKARRAASFGGVASLYERYRPGPSPAAVEWILSPSVGRVVDLGAGTGALTRLLRERVQDVIAVEPDDRMRSVLEREVPGVRAVKGRGESMPLPDSSVDAVLASSSWHWVEPVAALHEVGRVLVPGGILGVLWSGPDPEGPFLAQAQALLAGRTSDAAGSSGTVDAPPSEVAGLFAGEARRPLPTLDIPAGAPFDQPDHEVFTWDVALNADDMIGLLGTFSWIIMMSDEAQQRVFTEVRRLLRELLGVEGEVTVDVAFRADAWQARRHG